VARRGRKSPERAFAGKRELRPSRKGSLALVLAEVRLDLDLDLDQSDLEIAIANSCGIKSKIKSKI